MSQGILSKAQGGAFSTGFWSGFAGSETSGLMAGSGGPASVGEMIVAGTVGGTVSDLTGGDFANGAVSGAFIYLFNDKGIGHDKESSNLEKAVDITGSVIEHAGGSTKEITGGLMQIKSNSRLTRFWGKKFSEMGGRYGVVGAMLEAGIISKDIIVGNHEKAFYNLVGFTGGAIVGGAALLFSAPVAIVGIPIGIGVGYYSPEIAKQYNLFDRYKSAVISTFNK